LLVWLAEWREREQDLFVEQMVKGKPMAYISIEKGLSVFGQFLEYIFLGDGLLYFSGVTSMVFGTCFFFTTEKGIHKGIANGYPSSNARLIPWLRWGGAVLAVFGLAILILQLSGFFHWLDTL
jgi:hypothetical protein